MDNNKIIFENPELKSIDMVQIKIPNNGVSSSVPALSKEFVEKRYFLHYEPPKFFSEDGNEIIGAKEYWIELITYIIEDYQWLCGLPYYKFWSNIIYNPEIKQSLATFLQDAPPFYCMDILPKNKEVHELLNKLFQNALIIFARLVTNSESSTEFMKKDFQGEILYKNYIFNIPIIFDICQHYGRENKKVVSKIVESVFTLQPLYLEDTKETVSYIIQVLRSLEQRFEDYPIPFAGEIVKLTDRGGASLDISLSTLKDVILHLLDIVSTIGIFLEIYSPAISLFKNEDFIMRLVSVYSNTMPEMYKKLYPLTCKAEDNEKYNKLKHLLDVTRMESLQLFRLILFKDIGDVLEATNPLSETEIKNRVDDFIELITHAVSETEFMIDYTCLYPIDVDVDILTHICPTIDPLKIDYINQIVASSSNKTKENSNEIDQKSIENATNLHHDTKSSEKLPKELLVSLISEVKDILCDLDEDFILKCLKYYDYNSESVINAVLENTLPTEITNDDTPISSSSKHTNDPSHSTDFGINTNNFENFDEICDRVTDAITAVGINEKKKDYKYENLNEMLNDKSFIKKNSEIYNRFSLVADEYEDEYDDNFDYQDVGNNVQDDAIEIDAPFTTPRVLQKNRNKYRRAADEDDDDSEENIDEIKNTSDNFVQDPALLRMKAEEKRLSRRGRGGKTTLTHTQEKDVTGKTKGQGQDKSVTNNRNQKNVNKASQGNHNRRAGSSWKKRQGMVPF